MTIGDRIKKQRELLGISQVELSEKIKVSKQTLYKYENNVITNIPSDKIELIGKVLEVSPSFLMGWENEEKVADSLFSLTASPKVQQLVDVVSDMKPELIDKVIDYAEYVKAKEEGD